MGTNQFRSNELIKKISQELSNWQRPVKFMEVCGTHTMAIGHWGIRKLLPDSIKLISGPGCPVCVTPSGIIDTLLDLKDVTVATFGDLLRVPGQKGTLEEARAKGMDIRIIYSPLDALRIAEEKETVLVGIGFETTIPGIAKTIKEAKKRKLSNFSVLPAFKLVPPALKTLLNDPDLDIDGFILPGHVSVILGKNAYSFLVKDHAIGGVIAGFEPLDILLAIRNLIDQVRDKQPMIVNEYNRVVTSEGNPIALSLMEEVLQVEDADWRGMGEIKNSGLGLKPEYADFDARNKYGIKIEQTEEPAGCRCADVLKGKIIPSECPLFAKTCTPSEPIGACMVSSEGSCAAYYKYER